MPKTDPPPGGVPVVGRHPMAQGGLGKGSLIATPPNLPQPAPLWEGAGGRPGKQGPRSAAHPHPQGPAGRRQPARRRAGDSPPRCLLLLRALPPPCLGPFCRNGGGRGGRRHGAATGHGRGEQNCHPQGAPLGWGGGGRDEQHGMCNFRKTSLCAKQVLEMERTRQSPEAQALAWSS